MSGRLVVCPTPIGNLEDVTRRVLAALREADVVACEDTRHTRVLLDRYGVSAPLVSYHEHNEDRRSAELVERMQSGDVVALVSDAGMPLVSDPGYKLVHACLARGVAVIPIPGASALLPALQMAGLPCDKFLFAGFLPNKSTARKTALGELKDIPATLVFYESPNRVVETVADAYDVLGDRPVAMAREITKLY